MRVERLWLRDVRSYAEAELALDAGRTLIVGRNGQGKTNLVEALAFTATLSSFRDVGVDAMVRTGVDRAVIRAQVVHADGRQLLVEIEVPRRGRVRAQVNRQRLARTRDLLGVVRVSVFSPDDLELVKGGPSGRRSFVDEVAVACRPAVDRDLVDLDRILRQRAALLKQVNGRVSGDAELTLDVWDTKLAVVGEAVGRARADVVAALAPRVAEAAAALAGRDAALSLRYEPRWRSDPGGLAAALAASRADDLRRQITTVGPHRDDLDVDLDGMPARSHASQGEQRTIALALRLAAHRLVADSIGEQPVLVLDDVFSELDEGRSRALVDALPDAQVLLTTAGIVPAGLRVDRELRIVDGCIESAAAGSEAGA